MIKRYKIQLFPTPEQEELMWKHIHACRFIWNHMLEKCNTEYKENKKVLTAYDLKKYLTILRKEEYYSWLDEVSLYSIRKICEDLFISFKRFFSKLCGFPKFKSRKNCKNNFPVRGEEYRFYFRNDFVKIEKIGKIKIKMNRSKFTNYNGKYYNPRIMRVNNKWILSVGIDCENQAVELTDKILGIDLGVKDLATCSLNYEKIVFHNINKSKRVRNLEHKLKHIQRILSRKYRYCERDENKNLIKSKTILYYEDILRKIYYKLTNIRNNYIHQVTTYLIKLYPRAIVMEDLDVADMLKDKHMAANISKQCFYKFKSFIRYKCEFYNIEFVQVDRFYPSSKVCSNCGSIKQDLKLSNRIYICKDCGLTIDRDYNAAINLMQYGMNLT